MYMLASGTYGLIGRKVARGFSLIEAAVVLGIIGLVIGGIWIAAVDLRSRMRVNQAATDILQIATAARNLLPISSYPTVINTSVDITATLKRANIFPSSFVYDGGVVRAPTGASITVSQGCFSSCPMLGISHRASTDTWKPGYMPAAECIQLTRRLVSLMRDRSNLSHIQIQTPGNSGYQMLYPPVNLATVDCPDNFSGLAVWFFP